MSPSHPHAFLFSSCAILLAALTAGCGAESVIENSGGGGQSTTTSTAGSGGTGAMGGAGGSGGAETTTTGGSTGTAGSGGGGCTQDTDCPAANEPCLVAECQADGTCGVVSLPQGTPLPDDQQILHDCKVLACDGNGAVEALPGDGDVEDDGEVCTIDTCSAGSPVHLPAAADTDCSAQGPAPGKVCGDPGGTGAGKCVECNEGSGAAQCDSKVCQSNACAVATCADGVQNGGETGVDCGGGACSPCVDGQGCGSDADCQSGVCMGDVCQPPSCMDGVKNGAETDVDCGGGACPKCGPNTVCIADADCSIGTCKSGVCNSTSCTIPLSFPVPNCTDVASGKPAIANAAYPGYPIVYANDGVCNTGWNGAGYSGYWQVDLGAVQPIRGVSVAVAGTPATTVTIKISISNDGMTFTDQLTTTVPDPATITAYAFDFGSNVDARYVRFTESSPASWVDIWEANVWSCP